METRTKKVLETVSFKKSESARFFLKIEQKSVQKYK